MNTGKSPIRARFLTALVLVGASVVVGGGMYVRLADVHLQPVLSGSMRPTIQPGDLAVTQGTPISSLGAGDAIAFYPPEATVPVLHRITSVERDGAGTTITTRGDANSVDDAWHAILQGPTAYRLVAVVPFIGWLTDLRGPLLIAGGLLVALILVHELRRKEFQLPSGPRPA